MPYAAKARSDGGASFFRSRPSYVRRSMDAIDQRLLELLRQDANRPLKTLAAEVSLSRSSVRDRIARMRKSGVIRRFTIETAPTSAAVQAICLVRLVRTPDMKVVDALTADPQVARCHALSGEIDLLVEIVGQDTAAINVMRDRIAAMPGVDEVTTSLILARYKDPLD